MERKVFKEEEMVTQRDIRSDEFLQFPNFENLDSSLRLRDDYIITFKNCAIIL